MSNVNSTSPAVSPTPRRTTRPIPPAQHPFERIAWLFMRYSGLALIFLALSHFGLQHVFASVHDLTLQSTIARWGTVGQTANLTIWFWRAYYALLLGLAMLHGLNGLRQVAYDYMINRPIYYGFMGVAALLVLIVSVAGIMALALGVNVAAATSVTPLIQ
jgi:succinate dehydrogenase / fumarate reductase, membrane anchor subunit